MTAPPTLRHAQLRRAAVATLAAAVLAGCSTYRPAPLSAAPGLVVVSGMQAPMTVAQVDEAVLRGDPELRAARRRRGVAQAQLLQAGLLPDPQFAGSILPLVAGPGTTFAWTAGLTADVRALVTLSARREGARQAAREIDAQLLWQEWQAVGRARLLAVQLIEEDRALRLLRQTRDLFADRNRRLAAALAQGNVTLATAAPDLASLQTARGVVETAERQQLARRHQLNALMGREPDSPLALADDPRVGPLDPAWAERQADGLADRRPDLVALRLGYAAQEARTRAAVLGQFPPLLLGVLGGSDNSNVRNLGPQVSASLPIFDGNRGEVALQRATRAQLRAEYQARLDAAYGELKAALTELRAIQAQLAAARTDLPVLAAAAAKAERAFGQGALDELAYVDLVAARTTREQDVVTLEAAAAEQEVAIATLLGTGLPQVSGLPEVA